MHQNKLSFNLSKPNPRIHCVSHQWEKHQTPIGVTDIMAKPSLFGVTPDKWGVKNATAFEPERSPGISEKIKNPEARNEEKATNSIEGIGYSLLNAETSKILSGSENYRIWVMQCAKQEFVCINTLRSFAPTCPPKPWRRRTAVKKTGKLKKFQPVRKSPNHISE